ncbi:MAG TPA: hypothetical protein VGH76_14675 [Actinomycetospora sp.]|uniref:SCO6745 family protein n=1 Tax=Actinomycetospora sp. TaxID=1872135 RepID=UPI002F3EC1B8
MDTARRLWALYEPVHALTYFAPAALAVAEPLGGSFWARYVAQRAAPLGDVPTAVVVAAFGGFAPDRIADARAAVAPGVTPTGALEARLDGVDAAFADLAQAPDAAVVAEAADLAWEAAAACEDAGRVLGAANRALPRPAAPHLALWQATTTLREHRGDGHLAALAVHGVGPVASHVLKVAAGESPGRTCASGGGSPTTPGRRGRRAWRRPGCSRATAPSPTPGGRCTPRWRTRPTARRRARGRRWARSARSGSRRCSLRSRRRPGRWCRGSTPSGSRAPEPALLRPDPAGSGPTCSNGTFLSSDVRTAPFTHGPRPRPEG